MVERDIWRRVLLGLALALAVILWILEIIDRRTLLITLICISSLSLIVLLLPRKRQP
jgi:hypothetical protein